MMVGKALGAVGAEVTGAVARALLENYVAEAVQRQLHCTQLQSRAASHVLRRIYANA